MRQLAGRVSRLRGLPWLRPPSVEFVRAGDLREAARRDSPSPSGDARPLAFEPGPLGASISAHAAALYDVERRRLVLLEPLSPSERLASAVVHELTHALDDQHHDLRRVRDELRAHDPTDFTYRCLAEGSAETVRMAFEAERGGTTRRPARVTDRVATPLAAAYLRGAYVIGHAYVAHRSGGRFPEGVDDVFRAPPRTQSSVIHPARLPERPPAALPAPAAHLVTRPVGEADFAFWLDELRRPVLRELGASMPARDEAPWTDTAGTASDGLEAAHLSRSRSGWALVARWRGTADALEAAQTVVARVCESRAQPVAPALAAAAGGVRAASVGPQPDAVTVLLDGDLLVVAHGDVGIVDDLGLPRIAAAVR